jgi:hypothetical protein
VHEREDGEERAIGVTVIHRVRVDGEEVNLALARQIAFDLRHRQSAVKCPFFTIPTVLDALFD